MLFKIGEIARAFGVTAESIRHYEAKGLIHPKRNKENNYRVYSEWDMFSLMDSSVYRKFNFSLQDYADAVDSGTLRQFHQTMKEKSSSLKEQIFREQLLLEYMTFWQEQLEQCILNQGTFLVERVPDMWFLPIGKKHAGDDLDGFEITSEEMAAMASMTPYCVPTFQTAFSQLRADGDIKIVRGGLIFDSDLQKTGIEIDKEKAILLPEKIYLKYAVDIGDIGELNASVFIPVSKYLSERGWKASGEIYGKYLARVRAEDTYHRYVVLYIPLKSMEGSSCVFNT